MGFIDDPVLREWAQRECKDQWLGWVHCACCGRKNSLIDRHGTMIIGRAEEPLCGPCFRQLSPQIGTYSWQP